MKQGAEQDDPFSDWWMVRIEQKLDDTRKSLSAIRRRVDGVLAHVPRALSLGDNLSVHPVKLPLFVGSPLGFSAVYLLVDYDDLVRKLLLAHHVALLNRHALERCLEGGGHALRSLFTLVQRYRFSGTTRADLKAQNALWQDAVSKYGMPPPEIITGQLRSSFAPPLRKSRKPTEDGNAQELEAGDGALADDALAFEDDEEDNT